MLKKVLGYILVLVLGCGLGAFGIFRITQANHNQAIERISGELDAVRTANDELSNRNNELLQRNTRLAESVGELEKRIRDDNIVYQNRLRNIGNSLVAISEGIGGATVSIREIIAGLEKIKLLIESL